MISYLIFSLALFFYRQTKDVQDDMEEMETESPEDKSEEKFTMCKLLSSKNLRIPLFITLALQVIQQLSGINAVSKKRISFHTSCLLCFSFSIYLTQFF